MGNGTISRFPLRPRWSLLLLALGMAGGPVLSEAADADTLRYRWGLGWDDGLGARYLLDSHWGLGVHVNPDLDSESGSLTGGRYSSDNSFYSFGVLVFQQARIGRWVFLGPYAEVSYRYIERTYHSENDTPPAYLNTTTTERTWAVEVGFRPAFAIEERFVLESRFGFGIQHGKFEADRNEALPGVPPDSADLAVDQWRYYTTGQNLGFGSVLQFIIYF